MLLLTLMSFGFGVTALVLEKPLWGLLLLGLASVIGAEGLHTLRKRP